MKIENAKKMSLGAFWRSTVDIVGVCRIILSVLVWFSFFAKTVVSVSFSSELERHVHCTPTSFCEGMRVLSRAV